ncbi:MAG TPA: hypothetical protein PLJ84_06515 [Bacteroidales bacterium]|nr:hypothetical protein [Bacteroidales bacterium]HPT02233.1 hypothetical protein [Bacteroidales bacterium]
MKSPILKVVLSLVILVLAYLIFNSIVTPVKFKNDLGSRGSVVIDKLKDIRTAEQLFKQINRHYTGDFDSLVQFIRTGKIPVVKMIPDPKDTTFTRTISDTLGYVSIYDSIYSKKAYKLEELNVVPYSDGEKFELLAGQIDKGGVKVAVFEASTPIEFYSKGLNKQLVINQKKEMENKNKFPGLKVGSMIDASTDGNWE